MVTTSTPSSVVNSPSSPPDGANRRLTNAVRVVALLLVIIASSNSFAYSVLTHEEIVDLVWLDEIRPLLLKRYPDLTDDQIKEAHAYAYGGAVIQDLGYYPFGSVRFSNLAHYVRTGDFVRELLRESADANEYAFALGALAHYSSDITGHPAVNRAVAIEYPKLRAKYGVSVTYAENKTAHLKTEFGFDMVQVAKNRYSSQQYHDFIGFQVSKPLLERVVPVVYGVELKDVIAHEDLAIGSYRWAVSRMIPEMTQVALETHKKDMMHEDPDFAKQKFLYHLKRSEYEKDWGKDYARPGLGTRILAVFFRIIPKIGPFKALAFNNPTAQTEDMYFKSVNATVDQYRIFLRAVRANSLELANCDLDSGRVTRIGEYSLADSSYAKLLQQLSQQKFTGLTAELRRDILDFYSDPPSNDDTKVLARNSDTSKNQNDQKQLQTELDDLKSTNTPAQIRTLDGDSTSVKPVTGVCSVGQ